MTRVKADVYDSTDGEQEPWHNSNLRREFFMVPGTAEPAASADLPADQAAWLRVANSADKADIETFVRAWPNSAFRPLAEEKLEDFEVASLTVEPRPEEQVSMVENAVMRAGPGPLFRGLEQVDAYDKVAVIGMVKGVEDKGAQSDELWLKVRAGDGKEGFLPRDGTLRDRTDANKKAYEALLDEIEQGIKNSTGNLRKVAGLYTYTSTCNSDILNALYPVWFKGITMYSAQLGVRSAYGDSDNYSAPDYSPSTSHVSYYRVFNSTTGKLHFYKRVFDDRSSEILGFNSGEIQYDVQFTSNHVHYKYYIKCNFDAMKYKIGETAEKFMTSWQWAKDQTHLSPGK